MLFLAWHDERFVGRGEGAGVGIWLAGTFGQTEGGCLGRSFPPFDVMVSKPGGQWRSQTTVSFETTNLPFGITLIQAVFSVSSFGNLNRHFHIRATHFFRRIIGFTSVNTTFLAHDGS